MRITKYQELDKFVKMFAEKKANLIIIKSKAGLGKTSSVLRTLKGEDFYFINSHVTPLQFYKDIYTNIGRPILIDDVDNLLTSKISVSLLKQICGTEETKTIQYHSTSPASADVPMSFTTNSNVLILCNEFDVKNENIRALIDRGFYVSFEPSIEEVLTKMTEITNKYPHLQLDDRVKVLNFIKRNAKYGKDISLRTLIKAFQIFEFDQANWKRITLELMNIDQRMIEIVGLVEQYDNDKVRIQHFSGSKATYYRLKKGLKNGEQQKRSS